MTTSSDNPAPDFHSPWKVAFFKPFMRLFFPTVHDELEEQTKISSVTSWEQFARAEGLALGREQGRLEGR